MAITVTNQSSLALLNILNRTSNEQAKSTTRLSTGFRINSGKDDPAGLIASRVMSTELAAINSSLQNNQRTDAMLNVADKAMTEISGLLDEVSTLALASANEDGLSASEIAANQAQIDNALAAIDRIVGTTSFNGKNLLDGNFKINTSGVTASELTDIKIFSRDSESSTTLNVEVTQSASQAGFQLATTSAASETAITVLGKDGSASITIAAGENLSSVAAKVNASTGQTGVTASLVGGNLELYSSDFGTDAFVDVTVQSGDTTNIKAGRDEGVDATVTVNGQATAVDGKEVNFSSNGVSVQFRLTDAFNQATGTSSFTVSNTGGGTFQLGTDSSTRSTIGVNGLYTSQLGNADDGFLASLRSGGTNSLVNDPNKAAQIARKAAAQLATEQGRVGGFLKFQVGTAINQQTAAQESTTAALSVVRDVDYAAETANLNQQNVLLQSALSLLGVANQQSSQILSLLG